MTTTDKRSYAEQVAELKDGLAGHLPAGAASAFASEQAGLNAAGLPGGIARPGTPMPDGKLLDVHGEATTLAAARAGRAAIVVFYRGAWCPYCNLALRTYEQQLAPALSELGIALIAVSPQKPDGSLTMGQANGLTYTVVSDPGNQIAGRLGILTRPSAGAHDAQTALGLDIGAGNGDGTDVLPMPTTVLVDDSGVIRWIDVHPDYTVRTEPQAVLDAIASLLD